MRGFKQFKMKELKFDYDAEYDDLFVYSDKKSDSSMEMGDFVFDFTNDGELVAFQIQNALKIVKDFRDFVLTNMNLSLEYEDVKKV